MLNRRPDLPPPYRCPPDLADLLNRCWAREPGQRPDMPQVVSQLQGMVMTTCSFVPLATHVEQRQGGGEAIECNMLHVSMHACNNESFFLCSIPYV